MNHVTVSPVSPSLLRQFPTTPSGPRVISHQVLDIIFSPFKLPTLDSSTPNPSATLDESDFDTTMEGSTTEGRKLELGELERGEKCAISTRLMGLVRLAPSPPSIHLPSLHSS